MSVLQNYFGRIAKVSKSIIIGLGTTWRYLVRPEEIVTIQYGSEKYAPQGNYIPCCWQAGELIRRQCQDPESARCEKQVATARANAVAAGASGH